MAKKQKQQDAPAVAAAAQAAPEESESVAGPKPVEPKVSFVTIERQDYFEGALVNVRYLREDMPRNSRVVRVDVTAEGVFVLVRCVEGKFNGQARLIRELPSGTVVHYDYPRPEKTPEECVVSNGQVFDRKFLAPQRPTETVLSSAPVNSEGTLIQNLISDGEVAVRRGVDFDVSDLAKALDLDKELVPDDRKYRIHEVIKGVMAIRERIRMERAKAAAARKATGGSAPEEPDGPPPPALNAAGRTSELIEDSEDETPVALVTGNEAL